MTRKDRDGLRADTDLFDELTRRIDTLREAKEGVAEGCVNISVTFEGEKSFEEVDLPAEFLPAFVAILNKRIRQLEHERGEL